MAEDRALEAVATGPEWYGLAEVAAMLDVSRQRLQQRVGRLRGAQKVGGRWQIPADVVEALVTAERASASASGSLVVLGGQVAPAASTGDLADRVAELELAVTDQLVRFAEQLADRDARIQELEGDRRRLRQALIALVTEDV